MKMLEKKSWDEFQSAGLLWFVNRILHLFGWVIVLEEDEDTGKVVGCYPAHCKFRGFDYDDEEAGFHNLTEHIAENIVRMQIDARRGTDDETS